MVLENWKHHLGDSFKMGSSSKNKNKSQNNKFWNLSIERVLWEWQYSVSPTLKSQCVYIRVWMCMYMLYRAVRARRWKRHCALNRGVRDRTLRTGEGSSEGLSRVCCRRGLYSQCNPPPTRAQHKLKIGQNWGVFRKIQVLLSWCKSKI